MPIPQTADEAREQGYEVKKLSMEEAKAIMKSHDLTAGVGRRGKKPKDCSTIPPNGICWEGDCILGQREVLYCNDTQGCTLYAKVSC